MGVFHAGKLSLYHNAVLGGWYFCVLENPLFHRVAWRHTIGMYWLDLGFSARFSYGLIVMEMRLEER